MAGRRQETPEASEVKEQAVIIKQECAAVRAWLRQHAADSHGPPPEIVAHVEQCPTCRGALLLLGAAVLFDQPPAAIDCQACEDDLPGYLEYAAQMDVRAAARLYPHVWLHLWTCPDCAELAEMARTAMDEAVLELPMRSSKTDDAVLELPMRFSGLLRLRRADLAFALPPPSTRRGVTRSQETTGQVIAEEEQGEHRIVLRAAGPDRGLWHLAVWVDPPPAGHVVLVCGDMRLRGALDSEGYAAFDVPVELLSAPAGPDLELLLEHGAA